MAIWSDSDVGQYRDDDHQKDAPHFIPGFRFNGFIKTSLFINDF